MPELAGVIASPPRRSGRRRRSDAIPATSALLKLTNRSQGWRLESLRWRVLIPGPSSATKFTSARSASSVPCGSATHRARQPRRVIGHTTIGRENRFWPNCVIGGEPQDKTYHEGDTPVEIGSHNQFREGVTVNRGADKEDGVHADRQLEPADVERARRPTTATSSITRSSSTASCSAATSTFTIARSSPGNSVVHHFSTIGTLAFVSGGCRVPHDVPPYMMWAGSDDPGVRTINLVGLQRSGMSPEGIARVKLAYRLLYREHKSLEAVRGGLRGRSGPNCRRTCRR